jgi:hypothetical protein
MAITLAQPLKACHNNMTFKTAQTDRQTDRQAGRQADTEIQ